MRYAIPKGRTTRKSLNVYQMRTCLKMKTPFQAISIFCLLFVYVFSLPVENNTLDSPTIHKEVDSPCITEGCLTATATYLDNMDLAVDPCVDFYDFACGKFSEHTLLTRNNLNVNILTIRRDQHLAELRIILEDWKHMDEPDAFWKAKDFFFACMNVSHMDPVHSAQEFLESFGEWPLVEGEYWKGRHFNWIKMYTKLAKHAFSAGLFNLNFLDDDLHSTRTMLIRPSSSLVSRHIKSANGSESDRHALDLMALAGVLGADETRNMTTEARDVVALALQLSAIGDNITSTEEELTVDILQASVPGVNWQTVLSSVYEKSVSPDDPIIVVDVEWIKQVAEVLFSTDKRTVANYMLLEVLFEMHHSKMFPEQMMSAVQEYMHKTGTGPEPKSSKPVVVYCLKRTGEYLSHALAAMHARKYFSPQDKKSIHKLESSIRDELSKLLKVADFAAEDLHAMETLLNPSKLNILAGFYSEYFDDNVLEDIYRYVSVSRKDHFANMLALRKFSLYRHFGKHDAHHHLKNKAVSQLGQVEVELPLNKDLLVVPVSALRGIFYRKDRTHYLNYGSLGFVVGRGLASIVNAFTKDIDVQNDTLSSAEINNDIRERKLCYAEQYFNLKDHHQKLTSGIMDEKVVEELIKDTLGLRIANMAYEKWLLHHSPELPLPALDYTPKQLFWVSFANTLCHSYEEDSLKTSPLLNSIPGKVRVLSAVRNTPEFAQDFKCPVGSLMNPKETCSLV